MTQKERVLRVLKEAGAKGINSFWGYKNYIPRLGAIIHELKHEGYLIQSVKQKNHSTHYTLVEVDEVSMPSCNQEIAPKQERSNILQRVLKLFSIKK